MSQLVCYNNIERFTKRNDFASIGVWVKVVSSGRTPTVDGVVLVVFHTIHYMICIYVIFAISPVNSLLSIMLLISWELNSDFCILSQIEEHFFEMTFLFTETATSVTRTQKIIILFLQFWKLYYQLCWL